MFNLCVHIQTSYITLGDTSRACIDAYLFHSLQKSINQTRVYLRFNMFSLNKYILYLCNSVASGRSLVSSIAANHFSNIKYYLHNRF